MLIMGRQLKAARALLSWGQDRLADVAGVSIGTIKNLENKPGRLGTAQHDTVNSVREALEGAGIVFINSDAPGVQIKSPDIHI